MKGLFWPEGKKNRTSLKYWLTPSHEGIAIVKVKRTVKQQKEFFSVQSHAALEVQVLEESTKFSSSASVVIRVGSDTMY